jgi:bacterioferritin-associated ferredoxin
MKNVYFDPNAPNRAFCRLVSTREFYTTAQLFVCSSCRITERTHVQPRCPRCLELMVRVEDQG